MVSRWPLDKFPHLHYVPYMDLNWFSNIQFKVESIKCKSCTFVKSVLYYIIVIIINIFLFLLSHDDKENLWKS